MGLPYCQFTKPGLGIRWCSRPATRMLLRIPGRFRAGATPLCDVHKPELETFLLVDYDTGVLAEKAMELLGFRRL